MTDFRSIEELPIKSSIFPGWVAPFSQKWLLIIGIVIIVLAIVAQNNNLFYGDIGFYILMSGAGLLFLGFFCIWWSLGVNGRETKTWLNEDNTYDAVTPRAYSKLTDTWYHRMAYLKDKYALEFFAVADKVIYVETKDGNSFSAPISEIDTTFSISKGKYNETTTTKFNLSANGESISFRTVIGMLEPAEWEDIFNLLYRSKSFAETKGSKFFGKAMGLVTKASDLLGESSWADEGLGKLQSAAENATKMKLHGELTQIK